MGSGSGLITTEYRGVAGTRRAGTLVADDDPQWLRFWDIYPRRVAKKEARKAWAQLHPDSATVEKMITVLAWQSMQVQWLRDGGQYVPYPASWLRAERWEDEPSDVGQLQLSDKTAGTLAAASAILKGTA